MEIQPLQPVAVALIFDEGHQVIGHLIEISSETLRVFATDLLDKGLPVTFQSKFFAGLAMIDDVEFDKSCFTYTLSIQDIHYKPGLIINEKL